MVQRRRRPTFSGAPPPVPSTPSANYGAVSMSARRYSEDAYSGGSPGRTPSLASSADADVALPPGTSRSARNSSAFVRRWLRRSSTSGSASQRLLDDDDMVGIPMDLQDADGDDDSASLRSAPTSRHSDDDSTIDDVCMPLDSPREDISVRRTSGQKVWPDLSVLTEFALEELKEQQATEAAMSDRYAVNEAEQAGPLRPPRFVPWSQQPKRRHKHRHPGAPPATFTSAEAAMRGSRQESHRFTYFRDDLPATTHSPSISGLLQPGQEFSDLFRPVYENSARPGAGAGSTTGAAGPGPASAAGAVAAAAAAAAAGHGISRPPSLAPSLAPSLDPFRTGEIDDGVGPSPAEAAAVIHAQAKEQRQDEAAAAAAAAGSHTSHASGSAASGAPSDEKDPQSTTTPTGSPRVISDALLHRLRVDAERGNGPAAPRGSAAGSAAARSSSPAPGSLGAAPGVGSTAKDRMTPESTTAGAEFAPFWLDVLNPTEEELRVLAKAFGIHPLTTEDISLHETREKVELFHSYYFICFSSFDLKRGAGRRRRRNSVSDRRSVASAGSSRGPRILSEKLEPLPVYTIVFQTGVITIHYAPTPHTSNVRRRIRLLRDYLNLTSDWICYALIDDITDGFAPMISAIDEDVTTIDDKILNMQRDSDDESDSDDDGSGTGSSRSSSMSTATREWHQKNDMLRWIGDSRKRVMGLLGLLGSKADVIKGFSKRVTEHWSGSSRNEIALYLSDIQDHLVTMVQSLNHYEKLLARSHSNYLAQLNIDMNLSNATMNGLLNKLSVLGSILLPINIITGLWGMNVLVPGQNREDLVWFCSMVTCMVVFAMSAFFVLRKYL